jgi:hypothetical protein
MDEALSAIVVEHLPDAIANNPDGNDVMLADYIASKTNFGGRTDANERGLYVLALADMVRVRRHTVA